MFEKAKGLKYARLFTKNVGPWGFLLFDEKMFFVSHFYVKKNSCEIFHICFQHIILYIFISTVVFLYKKVNIYKDLYYFTLKY